MKKLLIIIFLTTVSPQLYSNQISKHIVNLSVITQSFDFDSPWKKKSIKKSNITGTVVGKNLILTKSYSLTDHVLIEASKNGESIKYEAKVIIKDYHNGLALIGVNDKNFFNGLEPVTLDNGSKIIGRRTKIYKWDSLGSFKEYAAEVNKSSIRIYNPSSAVLMHQLSSGMNDGGNGEPVFFNGKLAGITTGFENKSKTIYAISIETISKMLNNFKNGKYRGVPFFWLAWDAIDSDVNLRNYLGLKPSDSGIIITRVPSNASSSKSLKKGDVIMRINGNNIDDSGKYVSSKNGKLNFLGLVYLNHSVGDTISMDILRNRKKINVKFKLLPTPDEISIIPKTSFDSAPNYYIYGGLIFQELNSGYMKTWGNNWKKRANKRFLYYYNNIVQPPTKNKQRIIVLNRILPATVNSGYQLKKNLILSTVNGKKIGSLENLKIILESVNEKFIKFNFVSGESIVLNNNEVTKNNNNILKKYNI